MGATVGARFAEPGVRWRLAWQRIPDLLCWPFAGWTILCHLTVLTGGGLRSLLWNTAVVVVGLVLLGAVRARQGRSLGLGKPLLDLPFEPPVNRSASSSRSPWLGRSALAALASAAIVALSPLSWLWCWWLVVLFLALALVREELGATELASQPPSARHPTARHDAIVWLLVVLAIATALGLQRPDLDDTFYLNLSVAAAQQPDQPLLCCDSLHGEPGVEINFPSQRLRTLELLGGALAWLTGVAPIYWSHFLFPVIGALLLVTAYGRLLLRLVGDRWLACLVTVLVILATTGGPYAWYGNMAFVRLHQGKAIFATALVPLLLVYAIELARCPSRRRWWSLGMANVTAIGLTPSALWIAPAVSALALVAAAPRSRRGLAGIGWGLLATAYAWGVALVLRQQMHQVLDASVVGVDSMGLLQRSADYVLGQGDMRSIGLAAVLFSGWLCRPGPLRRFCLSIALGFTVVLFNPYLARWLAGTGTSAFTYWRVFWVLPLPLLLALCLTAPLGWWGEGWPARRRWQTSLWIGAAFLLLVPRWTWQQQRTRFTLPGLRVPPVYALAKEMAAVSPPGSHVLAPFEISAWLPTFLDHPYPLVTRPSYLSAVFAAKERRQRNWLTALVTRPPGDNRLRLRLFEEAIEHYDLQAIAVRTNLPHLKSLEAIMRQRGFVIFSRWESTDLWLPRLHAHEIRVARQHGR